MTTMDKLKMHSPNLTSENVAKIRDLFPGCVTEAADETGKLQLVVDFDQLRQELSDHIVEGPKERYRLDWPGKREAIVTANGPEAKTLRPSREESIDFETTKNLFVEGDNLEALKLLQQTYLGKIDVVYIDPPYNTGSDFVYDDDFSQGSDEYLKNSMQRDGIGNRLVANTDKNGRFHSDWLSMMYPRLKLARMLLSDNGSIFISIDDNEQASLKRLCDEIFGGENFINTVIWEKRYSPQNAVKWFSESHDFVIVYAKDKMVWQPNLLERTDEMNARYRNIDNDPRGVWKPADATAQAGHGTKSQFYDLTAPNGRKHSLPNGRCWVYTQEAFQKLIADNRIWFGNDGNNVPAVKRFLSEVKQGTACQTIWKYDEVGHSQEGKKELNRLFPEASVFETPKPVRLLKRVLQLATSKDAVVLDFFAGSGTTAHAAMQLNADDGGNRRVISVQIPEPTSTESAARLAGYSTIAEVSKERIRRSGQEIVKGDCHSDWNRDVGFRVLKVDTSNMLDVYYRPDEVDQLDLLAAADNIKPDRSAEDLLFQVLVDWGVDLTLPIRRETIQGKIVFFVDENALVACFETGVTEKLVKELASHEPLRVVFRDNAFVSDAVKINVEQVFRQVSPATDVRSI
jgi:adenine-specific DNA-methyltransferase